MFHMASPWDAWGMHSGNYGHPWASGAGVRRKRVADPFTFGRAWMGDESEDSDSDIYQNDYYRSAAPRRAAQPEPEWFCDPMATRRSRAAAPEPTTSKQRRAAAAPQGRSAQQPHPQAPLQHAQRQYPREQQQQQQQQHQTRASRHQPAFPAEGSPPAPDRRQQPARPAPSSAAGRPPMTPAAQEDPTRVPVRTSDTRAGARPKAAQAAASSAPPPAAAPNSTGSHNTSHGPRPPMPPSQAARTIQRFWRGWRLWRHSAALRQLVAMSRDLRAASRRFEEHLAATAGNLTDLQQLEVNEMAMRTILKLDGLEGLPQELRLLRKRLTATALQLQDDVHNTYARSSERPAHLRQTGPGTVAAAMPTPASADKAPEPVAEPPKCNASPAPSPAATPRRQSSAPSASPSSSPSPASSRQPSPNRQASPASSPRPATQPPSPATSQPATPRQPQSPEVPQTHTRPEPACAQLQRPPAPSPISSPPLSPSSSASLSDFYESCAGTPVVRGPVGHGGRGGGPKAWALSDRSISGTFSGASEDGDEVFGDALEGDCDADVDADVDVDVDDSKEGCSPGAKPGCKPAAAAAAAADSDSEMAAEATQRSQAPWWRAGKLWRRIRRNRPRRNNRL